MTRLVVEGSLADYSGSAGEAKMHQIRALFADETGVTTDKVAVVVQAAIPRRLQSQDTVNLDVIILCDTPAAATAGGGSAGGEACAGGVSGGEASTS